MPKTVSDSAEEISENQTENPTLNNIILGTDLKTPPAETTQNLTESTPSPEPSIDLFDKPTPKSICEDKQGRELIECNRKQTKLLSCFYDVKYCF